MILCCGEALIDMLPRESTAGEPAFAPVAGGAVFNTAIALARLGAPTGFFSGISTDLFGAMLADRLQKDGVEFTHAARSDRPTTLAFVTLNGGQASYAFYDENTAGRMLSPDDLPRGDVADAYFFGGISLVTEPAADVYEALCTRAHEAGRPIMLDPNIRPGFIRDETAYRARLAKMISMADIVKVSDEDLGWLLKDGESARSLLDQGPSLICLTEGAEGVRGVMRDRDVRVASRRAEVVDTVGAGDTFNAGVLAALHEAGALSREGIAGLGEDALTEALTLGTRAAAVTVSRAGANPPRRDELS